MNFLAEAEELQKSMAEVDLYSRPSCGGMEFLVLKLNNLKIKMYQEKGHQSPHVHIDYGKQTHTASYSINTGELLVGSMNRKYDKRIKEWVVNNQTKLDLLWSEC